MSKPLVFVNYEDPSQIRSRTHQHTVSTHTGKYSQELLRSRQRARQENQNLNRNSATCPRSVGSQDTQDRVSVASSSRDQLVLNVRRGEPKPRTKRRGQPKWRHWDGELIITDINKSAGLESHLLINNGKLSSGQQQELIWISSVNTQGPRSLLGQGRVDPFARFAVDEDHSALHAICDHGVKYFWPLVCPEGMGLEASSPSLFMEEMNSSPLAYYAYPVALSANHDSLFDHNPRKDTHVRLRLRNTCHIVRLVREALNSLQGPPADDLILSVLVLASVPPAEVPSPSSIPTSRFASPLADAQSMDPFGPMQYVASHWTAFYKLVEMKGGIHHVQDKGRAMMCQHADITMSTVRHEPPKFEYRNFFVDDTVFKMLESEIDGFLHDTPTQSSIASAFSRIKSQVMTSSGLSHAISAAAKATETLTKLITDPSPTTLLSLLELRNRAQFLALHVRNLDPRNLARSSEEECLCELVRIALLIYNNLILYPLSPSKEVGFRLAMHLKLVLETLIQHKLVMWPKRTHLILWILILGGIGDIPESLRTWYRYQIRGLIPLPWVSFSEWAMVKRTLDTYLWQGAVLDKEARIFWMETAQEDVANVSEGWSLQHARRERGAQ